MSAPVQIRATKLVAAERGYDAVLPTLTPAAPKAGVKSPSSAAAPPAWQRPSAGSGGRGRHAL